MTSRELRDHTRKTKDYRALAWDKYNEHWVIIWWNYVLEEWSTDIVGAMPGYANDYRDDELGEFRELPPDSIES